MKKLLTFVVLLLFSVNLFAQGFGSSKTTQSLKFPSDEPVPVEKARIYIIRSTSTLGNYSITVYLDDKVIGKVGPKAYLMFDVDTNNEVRIGTAFIGNNVRDKNEENQEFLTINPKPGKTYYVGVKAKYGTFRGQVEMAPVEANDALQLIPKLDKPKANYIE